MAPGWGTFFGGIGEILGKVGTYIPGRVEKLKNEKIKLEQEKNEIEKINMDISNAEHRKKAVRLNVVITRLIAIDKLLGNKATD